MPSPRQKQQPAQQIAICTSPFVAWRLKGEAQLDAKGNPVFRSLPGGVMPPPSMWPDIEKWCHKPPPREMKTGWRPIWCGGYEVVTEELPGGLTRSVRKFHHIEHQKCFCPPGPQIQALITGADEIALFGGRGSAKSETLLAFFAKGDASLPESDPASITYLNDPKYSFLCLRRNAKDLHDFFARARQFFAPLGGVPADNMIRFPSGAYGVFDHVADSDAPDKYQGHEYTRIGWEEATQEASEENYLKILMSCRPKNTRLLGQMMLTANPGGRGAKWFNARFAKVRREDGTFYKSGEIIPYVAANGDVKRRVVIFSTVDDNPYKMAQGYDAQLDLLKERRPQLWRRWRLGDPDAVEGQAFEEFREQRHPADPPEACHVLRCTPAAPEPEHLDYWWPRAVGLDWGYKHATGAAWGCWHPKRQLHVYREYLKAGVGTIGVGVELARLSLPDLERIPGHHMNVFLSPDAFSRTDDANTEAEQIARGIRQVIGNDAACFVAGFTQDEERMDYREALQSLESRRAEFGRKANLTLIRANNRRKSGWALLHEYLRWWRLVPPMRFDEEEARRILLTKGVLAWREYQQKVARYAEETLPQIVFWSCCQGAIDFMKTATEKDNDTEDVQDMPGDPLSDIGDAVRYLVAGFPFSVAEQPREVFISERLKASREANCPTDQLVMMARMAEYEYDRTHGTLSAGFTVPRIAGPTRRAGMRVQ